MRGAARPGVARPGPEGQVKAWRWRGLAWLGNEAERALTWAFSQLQLRNPGTVRLGGARRALVWLGAAWRVAVWMAGHGLASAACWNGGAGAWSDESIYV